MSALHWIAAPVCALACLVVGAALDGPTEAEALADTAAQVEDARIDEWVQAGQRANPSLTPDELERIRASARWIEPRKDVQ